MPDVDPGAQPWYSQLWNNMSGQYATDPAFWFSAMPAGLGILGSLLNANAANERYAAAQRNARATPDWRQFYQPMSDMAQAAMRRSIQADLATRGIPLDSAYASALTAERFGSMEQQMIQNAMQLAQGHQGAYTSVLMGAPQGAGGAAAAAGGSGMQGIGQYLMMRKLMEARQNTEKGALGAPGPVATQGLYGLSPNAPQGQVPGNAPNYGAALAYDFSGSPGSAAGFYPQQYGDVQQQPMVQGDPFNPMYLNATDG